MTSREKFEKFLVGEYEWGEGALNAAFFCGDDATGHYVCGEHIYDKQDCSECLFWAWRGWQAASKASEQQLAAVVAENAALKKTLTTISNSEEFHGDTVVCDFDTLVTAAWSSLNQTPATDAFLAEVRAQERTDFIGCIEWIIRNECNPDKTETILNELHEFAAHLRKGDAL